MVNVTELLEAVPRAKFRPLILSPVLFQYHSASEPAFRTLLCSRFRLSLSHIAVVIPGHGDKPLFPSQVPLSLPFQDLHFPTVFSCFQSPSILLVGIIFIMSYSLLEFSTVVESVGCSEEPACMTLVCREPCHIMFLTGVLEPVDPSPYVICSNALSAS